MRERLQKILSARGLCSRRTAEEWICAGRVCVNGIPARLGESADPDLDTILVDGKRLPVQDQLIYIMLHKPRGYVTTLSDEKGRPNAAQLVADCGTRVYPVGRLDMDSEGLLLFTNDGDLSNRIMHPKHQVDKVYSVMVSGYSQQGLEILKRPITLDGYTIRPPKVCLLRQNGSNAQFKITIHEGRNRQIRRMCGNAGMEVTRLVRIQEGSLHLADLPAGKWRFLSQEEILELKQL